MNVIGFKVYQLISLALIGGSFSNGAFGYGNLNNLNNLGDQITREVNQNLAPLQNLGPKITARVNQQLESQQNGKFQSDVYNNIIRQINWFHPRTLDLGYHQQQQFASPPFQPISPPIIQPILPLNLNLGLDNLSEQIQQNVYQGLEPVRALEIVSKMKNGVGGITIATFKPKGKTFIISNYKISVCEGSISESDGKCSGSLTPFKSNNKEDYCYHTQGYSIVNNYICIGASTVSVINNDIKCVSNNASPALLMSLDEFKTLCKGLSDSVEYRYIANSQDPAHVPIPNENKHVQCTNNQPGVCVFTETNAAQNHNGNVVINSGSSGSTIISG